MSMHEFEDLVEASVRALHQSPPVNLDLRSAFYTLYQYQGMFDTGYTCFRVKDILLEQGFFYRVDAMAFPNGATLEAVFDANHNRWLEEVGVQPFAAISAENPVVAFWHRNERMFYLEASSPLLAMLVSSGVLPAVAVTPPVRLDWLEVASALIDACEGLGDVETVSSWFGLMWVSLIWFDIAPGTAIQNPHLQAIHAVAHRMNATELQEDGDLMQSHHLDELENSDDEDSIDKVWIPFLRWWYNAPGL
jgi:hypothetical protein